MHLFTATILTLALSGPSGPDASQAARPQAPPRDPGSTPRTGTAVITGHVVAADTGRPLRRARITVTAPDSGTPARNASTDDEGRYEVTDLSSGRYRVSVARSGYLSLQYGQRRALEQGKLLEVVDGETLKDIDFVVPRMGVITGRVTDEIGDPIEGVRVVAMRSRFWEGRWQLVPMSGVSRTDDTGQYRVLGLPPGTYYVLATTRETWTVTERGVPRVLGYAPTYYPGTMAATDTGRVNVGLGQEVINIDVSLIVGRAASISGTALDSRGQPFPTVALRDEVRGNGFVSFGSAGTATVSARAHSRFATCPRGNTSSPPRAGGTPIDRRSRSSPSSSTALISLTSC